MTKRKISKMIKAESDNKHLAQWLNDSEPGSPLFDAQLRVPYCKTVFHFLLFLSCVFYLRHTTSLDLTPDPLLYTELPGC
jgi:hypothetical protein